MGFLFKSPFYTPCVLHSYFVIVLIVTPGPLWTDSVLTGCIYACVLLLLVIVSQNQCALLKLFFIIITAFHVSMKSQYQNCSLWQIYESKVKSWVTKPNTWSVRWLQVFCDTKFCLNEKGQERLEWKTCITVKTHLARKAKNTNCERFPATVGSLEREECLFQVALTRRRKIAVDMRLLFLFLRCALEVLGANVLAWEINLFPIDVYRH